MNAGNAKSDGTDRPTFRQWLFIVFVAVPLIVVGLPVVLVVLLGLALRNTLFVVCRWCLVGAWGKDVLVIYSNSPNWQEYFEQTVIPAIGQRATVLNWSERRRWPASGWRVTAFRWFAGDRDFNPLMMVFHFLRWPRCFRFHRAMLDSKYGNFATVRQVAEDLSECLGQKISPPASE